MLPTESAHDWHCKYSVLVDHELHVERDHTNGSLIVEVSMEGFEESADMILESHEDLLSDKT